MNFQSIIIPIYNGENWIDTCFEAITMQTIVSSMHLEVAVCDDASTDRTLESIETWRKRFEELSITLKIFKNKTGKPKGGMYTYLLI